MGTFEKTASAICYTIVTARGGPAGYEEPFVHNRTVNFVLEQHGRMPDYLRLPIVMLTIAFDWSALLGMGSRFHCLDDSRRRLHLEKWRQARIGVFRDFVKFYETLAVFGWSSLIHARGDVGQRE